jgi:hypothetical protein
MASNRPQVDDGEHPINFSQTFSLLQAGQSYFVYVMPACLIKRMLTR